jgi:hypothetical protein
VLANAQFSTHTHDLLESALEMGRQMIRPEMRRPGFLDAEQPVPAMPRLPTACSPWPDARF